jgi:DNA-directed RNA polymerase subunit RPC12/RpoP
MKMIFTNDLPKYKEERYKNKIDWKNSIGYFIKGIYDDIDFTMQIIDYYKKDNKYYLNIKYNDDIYCIRLDRFINCELQNILHEQVFNYKYNVGDIIVNVKSGKLKILEQIKTKNNIRAYKYKCLICGNEDIINEYNLINNHNGCNVCCSASKKMLVGYNDIWTTNFNLAKLLLNPNDGYKYTQNSHNKVDWKCFNCGNIIKNKKISMIYEQGLSCPKCSDKLPYPEKFVFNFLQQLLNNTFIYQLTRTTFKWCDNYRYDFYFKLNGENYIVETHGLGHYQEGFSSCGGKTVQEEQENDRLKNKLALGNGIREENYIIVDCRRSEMEWIKKHIIDNKLNDLFDLSKVNWDECHKYACSSLVKKACELWNSGIKNTVEIGKLLKLERSTIVRYLKQGKLLNWCNYDPKKVMKNNGQRNNIKVICLNNNKIFKSLKEASIYYNLKSLTSITNCCQGKTKSAGKDPITNEKLHWKYYEDYIQEK